jgi:hypothetical protein
LKRVVVDHRIARVGHDTEPASLDAALPEVIWVDIMEPLPEDLLSALARGLHRHPDVGLRVQGQHVDPTLTMLRGFGHLRRLDVAVWQATDYEALRSFPQLVDLTLRETPVTRPSLAVLRYLPHLQHLRIEGHDRDFEAVATLRSLRCLALIRSRVKSLDVLVDHPTLEGVFLSFGTLRDLDPLGRLPRLRDLYLHRLRMLQTEQLRSLSQASHLDAVKLDTGPHVTDLRVFGKRPAIRFLWLEGFSRLATLEPLSNWPRLQYLTLNRSRPLDSRLTPLLQCRTLQEVTIGPEQYPPDEVAAFQGAYHGDTFWYRGSYVKGAARGPGYFWHYVNAVRQQSGESEDGGCEW